MAARPHDGSSARPFCAQRYICNSGSCQFLRGSRREAASFGESPGSTSQCAAAPRVRASAIYLASWPRIWNGVERATKSSFSLQRKCIFYLTLLPYFAVLTRHIVFCESVSGLLADDFILKHTAGSSPLVLYLTLPSSVSS